MKYIRNSQIYVGKTIIFGTIGYMFQPIHRSLSGLHQNKSKVLLRNWLPNIFYRCKQIQNVLLDTYWIPTGYLLMFFQLEINCKCNIFYPEPDIIFVYNNKIRVYWDPYFLTSPLTYSVGGLMMTC